LEVLGELGIQYRVGHPAKIGAAETRKQKYDRRDARLLLELLSENRFPAIWMPSTEQRDLRTLLRDRDQWVKMRARLQHTLQAIALNHALRKRPFPVECSGAERAAKIASVPLYQSTTQSATGFVRSTAKA
jgi:transposase